MIAHLCNMVDLERGLALCVKVPVAFHLVKFTNDNLRICQYQTSWAELIERTSWLEPGSFTVVSWASLYRSNAGVKEGMISPSSEVNACTSATTLYQRRMRGAGG